MRLAGLRIVSGYFRLQVSSCKEFRTSSCLIWSIKTLTEKVGLVRKLRRFCTRNVREECVAWLPPFTCGGETLELLGPNWWSFGIWSTCYYPRIPILYHFAPLLIWDSRFGQPGAAREAVNPKKISSTDVATVLELQELNEPHTMERSSRSGWLQQILKEVSLIRR